MSVQLFIKPYDIFMPRGNSHFGVSSGDFGRIKMLPSPSLFAGAIRSFLASRDSDVLSSIAQGKKPEKSPYNKVLGSLEEPGTFRVTDLFLFDKESNSPVFPLPNDLVVFEKEGSDTIDIIGQLSPSVAPKVVTVQTELPKIAILKAPSKKPAGGYYLKLTGYEKYIRGEQLAPQDLIKESKLWKKEMRTGVALGLSTRSAEEGMLYTAEALNFIKDFGFVATIEGADELLNSISGDLSLGGDQRAASFKSIKAERPKYEYKTIEQNKSFKLILTAPAIFDNGWLPNNVSSDFVLKYEDCSAKLVCASINGYETVSGWNMVENKPKTAIKSVPSGSVYWFENFEGNLSSLKKLLEFGLWNNAYDKQRFVEGFNRAAVAAY